MEAAAVAKGTGDRADAAIGPWERLRDLCDPGSLEAIRIGRHRARAGARAEAGDGVVGASGGSKAGRSPATPRTRASWRGRWG